MKKNIRKNLKNFLQKIFSVKNVKHNNKKYKQVLFLARDSQTEQLFLENEVYMNDVRIFSLKNYPNITINIPHGKNNIIKLNEYECGGKLALSLCADGLYFEFGKNNKISPWARIQVTSYIAPGCELSKARVVIGSNNHFNGFLNVICPLDQDAQIHIGDYNLFAGNVEIKGIVDHLIYDITSKEVLNKEKGVFIGNKNWICEKVTFLNKAYITSNNIVGIYSVVNKRFDDKNCIIAGIPAKVCKRNVMWHQYLDDSYQDTDNPLLQVKRV